MTASLNPIALRVNQTIPLSNSQVDSNFTSCMRYAGDWQSGDVYAQNQVVRHNGGIWVCQSDNATDEPAWDSTQWNGLASIPGRGAMGMSAPTAGENIGAGWNPLAYFDTSYLQPYGFTYDLVNGLFQFNFVGLWQVNIGIFFNHNSSNSGRTTYVRLYSVTDAAAGSGVAVGIGRNVEDTSINLPIIIPVTPDDVDDVFRLEIGGGDAITAVTYTTLTIDAVQQSIF